MVDQILREIQGSFKGIKLDNGKSLLDAMIADSGYSPDEETAVRESQGNDDRSINWIDLKCPERIRSFKGLHVFLDADGFRFYLPAFMTWILRESLENSIYVLDVIRPLQIVRHVETLSSQQLKCMESVLVYFKELAREEDALDSWQEAMNCIERNASPGAG